MKLNLTTLDATAVIIVGVALLTAGGLAEHWLPSICWWFLGASGVTLLSFFVILGLVLVGDAIDSPENDF